MKIRRHMTAVPLTIRADAPVTDAMRMMLEHKVSGLPVVSPDGGLVGIVTEGDLLRRAELHTERRRPRWLEFVLAPGRLAGEYIRSHGRKVQSVMSEAVHAVDIDADLEDAVALMEKRHVKRVPVLDRGRLAGVVSRADLMRAFLEVAPPPSIALPDDRQIEARIRAEVGLQPWAPLENVHFDVKDGGVEIGGVVTDARTRQALIVLVENVAGVTNVVDRLVIIEPISGLVMNAPLDARQPRSGSAGDPAA